MDLRKSLGHALLEDAAPSAASPLRRRSIVAHRATPARVDTVNDDSTERAGSRRSLILPTLSGHQVRDGVAECIKLNTQNKINMKNAFSLSMIDFMMYMVKNRDEGLSNLQVASTTLDVSAKIYGLRVDSLHHDTMKMVGHFDQQAKDNNNEAPDDGNDNPSTNEVNQPERKKKKKKSTMKILIAIESIQCKPEKISLEPPMFGDADCQTTDMLYEAMLPKHCDKNLNLHPYKDVIFDEEIVKEPTENQENINPDNNQWPAVKLDSQKTMMSMFETFSFINWDPNDVESVISSQETQDDPNESLAFNLDASLPTAPDNNSRDNYANFFDINDDDNEENQMAQFQEVNRVPEQIVDVADVLNMVEKDASKQLEYSYAVHDVIQIRHYGTSKWVIKNTINRHATSRLVGACRQEKGRKKKELDVAFNEDVDRENERDFRIPARLQRVSRKTRPPGWKKELFLGTLKESFDKEKMIKYNLLTGRYLRSRIDANIKEGDAVPEKGVEINDYNQEIMPGVDNDFAQDDDDGGNYHMDLDDNHNVDEDSQNADDLQNNGDDNVFTQGGFVGDNLVEAPKLTEKIYIPFSQRAKKLDMRNLKKSIWKNLNTSSVDGTENDAGDDTAEQTVRDIKLFSNVFEKLPSQLNKNDASELTCPLAFVSLLHLANEKNLRIISNDDYSDLSIFQDVV